jgi:hypothetical protein
MRRRGLVSKRPSLVRPPVEDRLTDGLFIDIGPLTITRDHLAAGKRPTALRTSSSVQPIEL